jgi:AraC family transcriptional regulator, exoenzyme S synthesis regulatory protein ExsA
MLNAIEIIRANPASSIFELGELRVTQFSCPAQDDWVGIWSETDHLIHVLTAKSTWKTSRGTVTAGAGETVFFKKGALVLPPHMEENLCILIIFIPDDLVRETVRDLAANLSPLTMPVDPLEVFIPVTPDVTLSSFFKSMSAYVASDEKPPGPLLKLKLKELLTSVLLGRKNEKLAAYLRSLSRSEAPSIPAIMEANFCHNMQVEEFARMCHRSLSSFKREFQRHYGTTPGKWLLERRLDCSANLLRSTRMSVTEIAFECGFEEASHFSRAFKTRFGHSPSEHRATSAVPV